VRDEGSADYEEYPGEDNGREADSTQKSFGRLCVQGRQSHTGQSHRKQTLGVTLHADILQDIQETVKQACYGGQQEEQEHEAHRANTFLHTATQKQHGCDVQEKLSQSLVVEGIYKEPVDMSILKNNRTYAEDALSEVKICVDTKHNTGQ